MRYGRLFILVVSLVIAGCSKEQSRNFLLLRRAEKEVGTHPNTAICLLDSLQPGSLATDAERALYGLVRSEAIHRLGINETNDSLISTSRQYYERHHDNERHSRAQLHHGIYLYSIGQRQRGIEMIKAAEPEAESSSNHPFAYDLNRTMGMFNAEANNLKLAQHYYRKALTAARAGGDTSITIMALNHMIETFGSLGQYDSVAAYIDECLPMANHVEKELQATILTNTASYHLHQGDTTAAHRMLRQSQDTYPLYKTQKLMADIYAGQGQMERACSLWYEVLPAPAYDISIQAHHRLINHFRNTKQWKRMAFVSRKLNEKYEKIYVENNAQETAYRQARYDKDMATLRLQRTQTMMFAVAACLITVILIFVLYHRRRIKSISRRYASDLMRYNKTRAELAELQRKKENEDGLIKEKTEEIERLQQCLAEYQDDRRRPDDWNMQDNLLQSPVVTRFHSMAARGKTATDNDWNEMHLLAITHLPTLLSRLNSTDTLSPKESYVCLLIRLRFIPSEIAVLTATSPQSITNMRVRMLFKIFGERGGARDFDNRIRSV